MAYAVGQVVCDNAPSPFLNDDGTTPALREALMVVADQHLNRSQWVAVCVFCVVLFFVIEDFPAVW